MLKFSGSKTSLPALAVSLTCAVTALPATAQDNLDAVIDEAADDNVIIVTAQKREQSIKDVAVTVTAQSGEDLENLGVSEIDELSLFVPGLFVQEQSANNPGFVIRGITSDSGSAQQAPRVTLYYNGVDISRSRGSYQDLFDLERVEVIKGPQATLFGTASTIGAVSIISAKPEPGFSGAARVGYGNFDQVLVSGHLNLGNDVIAGRIAGAFKKRDGYVRNIAGDPNIPNQDTAGIDQDDLYAQDQLGLRASLRWTPSDTATVDLIGTYDRQRNSGTPFVSGTLPATGGSVSPFDPVELSGSPFSETALGLRELGLERDVYDLNLTIEAELSDAVTLTMINGYREFDSLEVFDADGSAAFYLEFAELAEGRQFSHETRLSYDSPEWRGFVGLNYFRERGRQAVPFSTEEGTYLQCAAGLIPGLPCVAPDGTVTAEQATALLTGGAATFLPYQSSFQNRGDNQSFSLFADATWLPTPELEITGGVRFLFEDRVSFYSTVQPNSVISGAPLLPVVNTNGFELSAEGDFDAFLPRFNVLYRATPNLNIYGTISKRRRSAVVDVSAATSVSPEMEIIPNEIVWNYEGGLKYADNVISASVGVFYQTYKNFQVSREDPDAPGTFETVNAGRASNFGVEAEARANIGEFFDIFASAAYIDAKVEEGNDLAPEFSGARFRLQSKWQLAGGFTADVPLNDNISIFLSPNVTYQSKLFFELPNSALISQDGYVLANIRGGLSFNDGQYEIVGFARNLFNKEYLIDAGNTGGAFGIPTFIPGEPRFYGVQLAAKF